MVDGFYGTVPKDIVGNLLYRRGLLDACREDKDLQQSVWIACSKDILFFINVFGWLYEPRNQSVIPFVTYGFQDELFLSLVDSFGQHDHGIEKSRDMGCSWIVIAACVYKFLFSDYFSALLVSRTEDLVDKSDDPDALMWKMDFLVNHLPMWMRPRNSKNNRTNLKYKNEGNGSVITGASTTGDVGRGGRRTVVLLDEFAALHIDDGYRVLAATQPVTKTRVFLSTPKGAIGAFYDVMHKSDGAMARTRLHWTLHPDKSVGLYCGHVEDRAGLEVFDQKDATYPYANDYKFIFDGKLRSPWYDNECLRSPDARIIAQELDIDYVGAGGQFFDPKDLQRCIDFDTRNPVVVGDLDYDHDTGEPLDFYQNKNGHLRVWEPLTGGLVGKPLHVGEYTVGVDISMGTGSSNSSISVFNKKLGMKVAELTRPDIDPSKFALLVIAICKWYHNAFMVFESNGPGKIFSGTIVDSGYTNVFFRRVGDGSHGKRSKTPGWYATRDTKLDVLGKYRLALSKGSFKNPSRLALEECRYYVYLPDGSVDHAGTQSKQDPSGARDNHGDRVTADALSWIGAYDLCGGVEHSEEIVVYGSLAYRRKQALVSEMMESDPAMRWN